MKDLRQIVKTGYERGDYSGVFRTNSKMTAFEQRQFDRLMKSLPSKANVLDLGCGTGIPYDTFLAASGARVSGVDFVEKHIIEARKNVPTGVFTVADFSQLEFAPETFDAIISLYAIFHIPRMEQSELFAKIYRWLKPGGIFLATYGTSDSEGGEYDWIGSTMSWSTFNPEKYRVLLKKTGYIIAAEEFEGEPGDEEYHWWAMAQKPNR